MRRRGSRPRQEPTRGQATVDVFFRRVGLDREARGYRAMAAWHRVAGPRLTRHTRAERVWNDCLVVRVASAAWANELSFLRQQLLDRLRAVPGLEWVSELRFSVGPLDELPDWDAPDARDQAPVPPAPPPPPPFTQREEGAVAEALLQVRDPELRHALADLFTRDRAARR